MIKNIRQSYYLTQKQIANYLKIYQVKYHRYEIDYPNIPIKYIICLSFLYDIDLYYILGITNVKGNFNCINRKLFLKSINVDTKTYYEIGKEILELDKIVN